MARNEFGDMKTFITETLHDSELLSKAGDWINQTVMDIHRRTNFRELHVASTIATVADQIEYDYSDISGVTNNSEVDHILGIRDQDNDVNLQPISYATLYEFEPDPENEGTNNPVWYYIKDEKIGLVPVPNSVLTYQIDYKKRATDMSADADTLDLPDEWLDVVLTGAEARGLRYQKRQDWVATHQLYEQMVSSYMADTQPVPRMHYKFAKPGIGSFPRLPRIKV